MSFYTVHHVVSLLVFDLTYLILIVLLFRKDPIVLPFRIDCYRPVYKTHLSPEVKP